MQELTREDWVQWLESPVTKSFFNMIAERREETIAQLAYGNITSSSRKDIAVGAINAYTHILGVRFEEEEKKDGTEPSLG